MCVWGGGGFGAVRMLLWKYMLLDGISYELLFFHGGGGGDHRQKSGLFRQVAFLS